MWNRGRPTIEQEVVSSSRHETKSSRGRLLDQGLEVKVEAMERASRAQGKLLDQELVVEVEAMEHASWDSVVVPTTAQARIRPILQMRI